ncbi:MAG: murein L,D-transpeptidase catalytic domain family protein [Ginsengibacter sp.]
MKTIIFQSREFYGTDTEKVQKPDLFDSLHLGKLGLARRAYDYAMLGYKALRKKGLLGNDQIITIADLTLPSNKKRLFVFDVKKYKILFVTYVAHGKNSGLEKALYFSNDPESNKSSVGFYTTKNTYTGAHGYSMRLDGHEIGFNNNAESRDIVVHSADYVGDAVVKAQGYLGRSLGCPVLSPKIYKSVIERIKNGTCLFVYGNDSRYIMNSKYLKQSVRSDSTSK